MLARRLLFYCFVVCIVASHTLEGTLTRLTNNDPYPLFASTDPYEFLARCVRNDIEDYCEPCNNGCFRMSFSVFRQSALAGTDMEEIEDTPLGDLKGRWNMIGLFYDPKVRDILIEGLDLVTSFTTCITDAPLNINLLTDPAGADPKQEFGFLSVPILYRKYGSRFVGEFALPCGFSLELRGGVAQIWQEPNFIDLSCTATGQTCPVRDCTSTDNVQNFCSTSTCCPPVNPLSTQGISSTNCVNANCCIDVPRCECKTLVIDKIIKRKDRIEKLLGLQIDESLFTSAPFIQTGLEDTEINLNWLNLFPVNKGRADWPFFVLMPFASLGFTIPTGTKINKANLFALPTGNNGHWSYGGRFGMTIDFVDAFTIGGEIGFTGFTPRVYKRFPAPTQELQSGVFPEVVSMRVTPGFNWNFAAYFGSYRFLDRFSAWAQYVVVSHQRDEFELVSPWDPNCYDYHTGITERKILFHKLRQESSFRAHFVNVALNYEISPNIQLGIGWQIPVFQQNAYRSSTVIGTFQIFF